MNVLIMCGDSNSNIINQIKDSFRSGNVDFLSKADMSNMAEFYDCGNYFDRAVITEAGMTRGIPEGNTAELRERLHDFIEVVQLRQKKEPLVIFACKNSKVADILLEETSMALPGSLILYTERNFSVSTFVDFVGKDPQQLEKYSYARHLRKAEERKRRQEEEEQLNDLGFGVAGFGAAHGGMALPGIDDPDTGIVAPVEGLGQELPGAVAQPNKYEQRPHCATDSVDDVELPNELGVDGVGQPEQPDVAEPDVAEPDVAEPDVAEPDVAEPDVAEPDVAEQVDVEQMFNVAYEQEQPQEVPQQPEIEYATEGIEQYFSDSMFEQPQAVVEQPQAEAVDKVPQQDEAEPQQPVPQVQQQQYEQQATQAEPHVNYGGNQYGDQPAQPNEAGQPEAKNGGNGKRGKPIFGRRKQAPIIDGAAPTEPQGKWADAIVKALSMRGQLVIVTGPSNVGKTTLVQGLADIAESIGCSVLMADFDINGRGLSYCSTKNYEAIHRSSYTYCSIRGAVNSGASGEWEAEIVSPGKHMLGTGLAYNKLDSDWANSEAVTKWAASCKTMYNLTICDVPWEFAMGAGQGLVFNSDFIVITSGLNNHDLMQLVLDMCNIDDDDVAQIVWDTSVMALTKVGDVKYVFGKKVRSVNDVLAAMDDQVAELIGGEAGYKFADIRVACSIPYDTRYEDTWMRDQKYTSTQDGREIYSGALRNILNSK